MMNTQTKIDSLLKTMAQLMWECRKTLGIAQKQLAVPCIFLLQDFQHSLLVPVYDPAWLDITIPLSIY